MNREMLDFTSRTATKLINKCDCYVLEIKDEVDHLHIPIE